MEREYNLAPQSPFETFAYMLQCTDQSIGKEIGIPCSHESCILRYHNEHCCAGLFGKQGGFVVTQQEFAFEEKATFTKVITRLVHV